MLKMLLMIFVKYINNAQGGNSMNSYLLKDINKFRLFEYETEVIEEYVHEVDGLALKFIPKNVQTKIMVYNAVSNNGMALRYANGRYMGKELYKVALKSNAKAYEIIPDDKMDEELYEIMVTTDPFHIRFISSENRTENICITAVRKDGRSIRFLTSKEKSAAVIHNAIKQNASSIQFIESITEADCRYAIDIDPHSIKYIDEDKIEDISSMEDLYLYAINKNPEVLQHISANMQTYKICRRAVELESSTIAYVSIRYYFSKYYSDAVQCGLLEIAVNDNPFNITLVDSGYWNDNIIDIAIKRQSSIVKTIVNTDGVEIAKKGWMSALSDDPTLVKYIPDKDFDEELAIIAVSKDPKVLLYFRSGELCSNKNVLKAAIATDPKVIKTIWKVGLDLRLFALWIKIKRFFKKD